MGVVLADSEIAIDDGNVYFLRNPYTVIRERPEYILRFFQAQARHGKNDPDEAIVAACASHASRLPQIGPEKLQAEMRAILALPAPTASLELMERRGVLNYAMGFPTSDFTLLAALEQIERLRKKPSPWYVRLLLMLLRAPLPPEKALAHLALFWKIKNDDMEQYGKLLEYFIVMHPAISKEEKSVLIDKFGASAVSDMLLLRWALEDDVEAESKAYLKTLKG